jgi:hypothetical protein
MSVFLHKYEVLSHVHKILAQEEVLQENAPKTTETTGNHG